MCSSVFKDCAPTRWHPVSYLWSSPLCILTSFNWCFSWPPVLCFPDDVRVRSILKENFNELMNKKWNKLFRFWMFLFFFLICVWIRSMCEGCSLFKTNVFPLMLYIWSVRLEGKTWNWPFWFNFRSYYPHFICVWKQDHSWILCTVQ